jgi:predicted regulator of Ras-like GTPase activity (Roadblock/LC7/MglB family)
MTNPYRPILASVMRLRDVTACLLVDENDGVIVDSTLQFGMRGNVFAALIASLYRRARHSAVSAGMGEASFVQLDAERGRVCAVGRNGLVLIAVAAARVNVGLLRVELLKAREALA